MKTIFLSLVATILTLFSVNVLAEKVVITGEPVIVTGSGEVYTLPETTTYTTTSDYYYVTIGDKKRVCYREVQPSLAKVGLLDVTLRLGSDKVLVHCYEYTPEYFIVK